MATIPVAPRSRAFSIIRSTAWRRLSSSSSVYWGTSPLRSEVNPAVKFLARPMLRTTRPKQTPRFSRMARPGSSTAVVMGISWRSSAIR
jgi:hypothetical protein